MLDCVEVAVTLAAKSGKATTMASPTTLYVLEELLRSGVEKKLVVPEEDVDEPPEAPLASFLLSTSNARTKTPLP